MSFSATGDILKSRILLVEEDESMARLVRLALGQAGLACDYAPSATQGLQKFQSQEPHLVLLSLGLPNLGGVVLCPQIRAISTVPIMILSVRTRREDQLHALNLGADEFLCVRPPDEQLLVARILTLLRRTYVYNHQAAAPRAAPPSSRVTPHAVPEGWVTCESCSYMGPSHRFEKLDAIGRQSIVCPHCSMANSVRFAIA